MVSVTGATFVVPVNRMNSSVSNQKDHRVEYGFRTQNASLYERSGQGLNANLL